MMTLTSSWDIPDVRMKGELNQKTKFKRSSRVVKCFEVVEGARHIQ